MNRTTAAQRYNKRMDDIFNTYHAQQEAIKDYLPTCTQYTHFLDEAVKRLKISRDEARTKYGKYTHGQWKELLKLF